MKYVSVNGDNRIFLTLLECVESGISEAAIKKATYRNSKSWVIIKDPDDARATLICFDALPEDKKSMVIARWGNPAERIARDPIRKLISPNPETYNKLLAYRYGPDEKALPIKRVKQYARACDILDTIIKIDESQKQIIKDLGLRVPDFYSHISEIIIEEQKNGESESYQGANQLYTRFPSSYVKLREKANEYKKSGYNCVIDKSYGKTPNLKVKAEDAKDLLISLLKNPLQYSDVLVAMLYNTEANKNGWKQITPGTVQNWRQQYSFEITPYREGQSAFNEKFIREVKGLRPSQPLFLVEHDDNNLDLLFQDPEDGSQFNKYVAIVVTDSHCDLVLGKSVIPGKDPMPWQVHHAYIDAMYYIRSLTGGWYLPHELKADKWAKTTLFPLYDRIAQHVTPAHGNKHRGYIEQFFRSELWKNSQKLISNGNWTGHNMTAKSRGFNPDMLEMSFKDKSRPMIGMEAEAQIEQFFYLLRNMPDIKRTDMQAASKEQKWLNSWAAMKDEDKKMITDEQFLLTFGITHKPRHTDTIRITNRGVEPTIGGIKYSYDLPENWMYDKLRGEDVQVVFDPYDMSRVLITNSKDIRFIARTATLQPRALKDQFTGSRTFLNAILDQKRGQVDKVQKQTAKRKIYAGNHAEALLQSGMVLPKEVRNEAEVKALDQFTEQYDQYLDENININDYL